MKTAILTITLLLCSFAYGTEIKIGNEKILVHAEEITRDEITLVLDKIHKGKYIISAKHKDYVTRFFPVTKESEPSSLIFSVIPDSISIFNDKENKRIYISWTQGDASRRWELTTSYVNLNSPREKIRIERAAVIVSCP